MSKTKIKIYTKRGNTKYDEKRYIDSIQDALDKEIAKNPNFLEESGFKPASTREELESLYNKYAGEEVEFVETESKSKKDLNSPSADVETEEEDFVEEEEVDPIKKRIDPMNREEPIVRDYVMDQGPVENAKTEASTRIFFEEPAFGTDFELPSDEPEVNNNTSNTSSSQKTQQQSTQPNSNQQQSNNASSNNNNDDADVAAKKKTKQTKRFAKSITDLTCALLEKGFAYWGTKGITDADLAELELSGEIDLTLMLTLEDDQEATVKEFFSRQCKAVNEIAKIEDEEKEEIADALADVLLEKGIGPTPTQMLLIAIVKVVAVRGLGIFAITQGNRQVMAIVKKESKTEDADYSDETHSRQQQAQNTPEETDEVDEQELELESNHPAIVLP